MSRCEWCHELCASNGGEREPPGPGLRGPWCTRCVTEYHAWPADDRKFPSGLLPGCQDAESGNTRLLFGYERGWCHFQGNADPGDRDNVMVACREAAEETCFAIGAPRSLKVNYFDTGNAKPMFGGAWLIDMGILSLAEQQAIVDLHHANLHGALWRKPTKCESEMSKLQWVEAQEVLAAIEASGGKNISVPSLGSSFRAWTVRYYPSMAERKTFREFCLRKGESQPAHCGYKSPPCESVAGDVKVDVQQILNSAKNHGDDLDVWSSILKVLDNAPDFLNDRGGRSFGLLHHAAYWGQVAAVQSLVQKNADVDFRAKDGKTAAEIAAAKGHAEVASFLGKAKSIKEEELRALEILLDTARDNGGSADTWETIFTHLQRAPGLVNKRNGRSFGFLHHAAYWGQQEPARRLLADFHADNKMTSKDKLTPAQVARSHGEHELAALIEGWS
eukprot:TRINITY_DN80240_c0_g1_i1.p1 TRINITY_DN80240_c0_g1~~TRINITY_DN80240_c0_g1_i1.p1  ORF type:complete len:447 (-),score=57.63 TRINITY_DN80240_c0_g1_i1:79-1419(-)